MPKQSAVTSLEAVSRRDNLAASHSTGQSTSSAAVHQIQSSTIKQERPHPVSHGEKVICPHD